MEDDIKQLVSFEKLKGCIVKCRLNSKYIAQDLQLPPSRISRIITGWDIPKTDVIAKLSWSMKVPCSEFMELKGIEPNERQMEFFKSHELNYKPREDSTGELTYEPLRELISLFLDDTNSRLKEGQTPLTENDLLDRIEPYRRRNGMIYGLYNETYKKGLAARGIDGETPRKTNRNRKPVNMGLTQQVRTKLRNDRPLSMRTVYDICHKLGCSIDWVLSYK